MAKLARAQTISNGLPAITKPTKISKKAEKRKKKKL